MISGKMVAHPHGPGTTPAAVLTRKAFREAVLIISSGVPSTVGESGEKDRMRSANQFPLSISCFGLFIFLNFDFGVERF